MLTQELIKEFLDKKNIFAVVGVSLNENKYGNKVFRDLLESGYRVYPIHPDKGMIRNQKRYDSLLSLPKKADVVCLVVPPTVSMQIVKQCFVLGIDKVWLQPGSESKEILNFCQKKKIKVLHDFCIMAHKTKT